MLAVFGSGISSMSDASMPFQPAIDEPSKAWPPVNLSSLKAEIGTRDVLLLAAGVGEAEVDELDFALLHHVHHVGDGLGHQSISQAACNRCGGSRIGSEPRAGGPKIAHGI